MENAGGGTARIIDQTYGPRGTAFVACGTGNNGGDGLVIARHLHNFGWKVRVAIVGDPAAMSADCATNDRVVRAMNIERLVAGDGGGLPSCCDGFDADCVVVDALLGTGFRGLVRPALATAIDWLNIMPRRAIIAVDVPSGLDCDTGLPGGQGHSGGFDRHLCCVEAGVFDGLGSASRRGVPRVGIGVPRELIERVAGTGE